MLLGGKFAVINEELILESIQELQKLKEEDDKKKSQSIDIDTIEHGELTKLVFSFKNIYKISNLEGFKNLRVLLLDNNNISSVSNISHLSNLTRLDLSFNKISTIHKDSFENLSKLENLSLYGNEVVQLINLEPLENLKCFNIGNNKLEDNSNIKYLRQFKKLRSLVLCDNPLFDDRNYKNNVLEFLCHLTFLDHRLVLESDIDEARGRSDSIKTLEDEEKEEKKRLEERKMFEKEQDKYREAGIESIDEMYDQIFKKNPTELEKFEYFTKKIIEEDYFKKFTEVLKNFKKIMFEQHKKKTNEIEELEVTINEENVKNMHLSRELIKNFERQKKSIVLQLEDKILQKEEGLKTIEALEKMGKGLAKKLIEIEVNQSEAFIDVIEEFIENYQQLDTSEIISSHFRDFKRIDVKFAEKFKSCIISLIPLKDEKIKDAEKKQNLEIVKAYLDDKDQLLATLLRSTETRMEVINLREELYLTTEKNEMESTIGRIKRREHERNRLRIFEIWSYLDRICGREPNARCEISTMRTNFLKKFE